MPPKIKISGYKPAFSQKRQCFVPGCIPYETDFYIEMERIKNGYYRAIVEQCRAIEDKKQRSAFKQQYLPSITISAVCREWRKTANVVEHSGLMNIDIDDSNNNVDNWPALRDTLSKAPIVVAAFLSASGKGLSLVVKVHSEQHYDSYRNFQLELKQRWGILADSGVHDVVRLRFVSYDPEAYINHDFDSIPVVELTPAYLEQEARRKSNPVPILATGAANSAVNFHNAVTTAQKEFTFSDGQKHFFLVALAGYCNTTGMEEETCCKYVLNQFGPQTTIDDDALLEPIRNVYRRYSHQFGETPLRKIEIKPKELRWLLNLVTKDLLRAYLDWYGMRQFPGETPYKIKVSSPLLAFFMWLACPQYTWTVGDSGGYDQEMSNDECKDIVRPGALVDSCNGNREWVCAKFRYPLSWGV